MKKLLISAALFFAAVQSYALDVNARFTACGGDVRQWLSENIRYPVSASETATEGYVVCLFRIGVDGSVSCSVLRSSSEEFAAEALRLARMMPRWVPAMENGRRVAMTITVPLHFRQESD